MAKAKRTRATATTTGRKTTAKPAAASTNATKTAKTTAAKTAPKKAAATKAAPKKTAAKKTTPRKAAPKKAAPRKTAKRGNGDFEAMSASARDAYALSEAAIMLDQARGGDGKPRDAKMLAAALERELEVWTVIRTVVQKWDDDSRGETKHNLLRLADFVSGTILSEGIDIKDTSVETLININLQIAEGLLEGDVHQQVREEAYRLWEAAGRPTGQDQAFWFEAERKVRGRA